MTITSPSSILRLPRNENVPKKYSLLFFLTLSDDVDGTLPLSSALPRPVIGTVLILIRVYIEVEKEQLLYKKAYSTIVIPGASSASTSWANSEQKQQKQLLHSEN